MDEELDYGEEEASHEAPDEQHEEDAYAGAGEDAYLYVDLQQDAAGSSDRGQQALRATSGSPAATGGNDGGQAVPPRTDAVPEEWQVMDVPDEWRPLPMVRVWGLPAAATEAELQELLGAQGLEPGVRSVALDPKQATAAGKVALVRFQPPAAAPLADPGAPLPPEPDVGETAARLIAALRAKAPELHGRKLNVEKTAAEVCLFLSNLPADLEDDGALRGWCEQHGGVERCFVVRNPAGDSKRYAFAEFTLPAAAAAAKEAWNKAGDAQRPQTYQEAGERKYVRVKLQRAEAAPVRSVAGLFASTLYVDNLLQSCSSEPLRRLFSEFGEVTSCHLPRSTVNPGTVKGFAFVHFKHSFAADAAFRALDGTEHEGIGRLLISFSNPVKAAEALHRAAAGGGGAARSDARHAQPPRHQQRDGGGGGGRTSAQGGFGGLGASCRSGGGAPRVGAVHVPGARAAPSAVAGLPGGAPILLPGSALPPPPPPPPNPLLMQQAALQQAQAAMQQRLAMQQMLLMQQQPLLAMQQAMMAQAAEAAKKEEEERRRKEAERKQAEEEKARQEAEYSARLGYGMGGFGGMPSAAALGGLAGNPSLAAMAAAAGLPGFGAAFGAGLGGGGGLASGLGAGMAGLGGLGAPSGGSAAAGGSHARSAGGAADAGRGRAAGGEYGRSAGGEYGGHAANGDEYGGDAGYGRSGRGGSTRGGGGGYRPDEWGEDWDSSRGGGYDAYGEEYGGSNAGAGYGSRGGGYGGGGRRGGGGQGGRSGGGGFGGGGSQAGGSRGAPAKRDGGGYQAYGDSYTAPKRPRY